MLQKDALWVAKNLVQGAPLTVGQPDITELVRRLQPIRLDPGSVLYSTNEQVPGVWIIRSGCVSVTSGSGANRRVLSLLREGEIVGDSYLLLHAPSPVTARATEPTICWFLPASDFRSLISTYPSIGLAWMCNLASRLCRTRERIANSVGGSLVQKLGRLLLSEATEGEVRLSQKMIAEMLGVQRTSVNKAMKELEREGVVSLGYGTIVLNDDIALASLTGGYHDVAPASSGKRID